MKKKLVLPPEAKRELSEPAHQPSSSARQGNLLGLSRATSSYPAQGERAAHLAVMRFLEPHYPETP